MRAVLLVSLFALSAPAAPRIGLAAVQAKGRAPKQVAATVEAALEVALRKLDGATVVTASELATLLGVERQRQLTRNTAEERSLTAALNASSATDLLTANVSPKGAGFVISARRSGAVSRTLRRDVASNEISALISASEQLVADLFPELKPKPKEPTVEKPAPVITPSAVPNEKRAIRVAVLEVRAVGEVPARALAALNQSLTPELRKVDGVSAISASEVADMVGLERQKQLVGCSEEATSCMEELAGALDADEMVTVDLTLVGSTYAMTARRLDARKNKVVQTELKQFPKRDGEELLAVVGPTIAAMYPERSLKPGRNRGVEESLVRRLNPPPVPRWVFFTTAGAAVSAGLAGGVFGILSRDAQSQYRTLGETARRDAVRGQQFVDLEQKMTQNAGTANMLLMGAGALAVASVVMGFFTDWNGDAAALEATPIIVVGGGAAVQLRLDI